MTLEMTPAAKDSVRLLLKTPGACRNVSTTSDQAQPYRTVHVSTEALCFRPRAIQTWPI